MTHREVVIAALEPFAEIAKHYAPYRDEDIVDKSCDYPIRLIDLRNADKALTALKQEARGDVPSREELMRAVHVYQKRTGQTLEDTLAGKWTNPPAQDERTLPELPEGWEIKKLEYSGSTDERRKFKVQLFTYKNFETVEANGPTARAAVLAAVAKITPPAIDGGGK